MVDYKAMLVEWEKHLRDNASTPGDIFWDSVFAEWQAFKRDWEEPNESNTRV